MGYLALAFWLLGGVYILTEDEGSFAYVMIDRSKWVKLFTVLFWPVVTIAYILMRMNKQYRNN